MDKQSGSLPGGYLWAMKKDYRMYLAPQMSNAGLAELIEELMIQKPR